MPSARYFLPDQPKLQDVYSKDQLRVLLQKGALRRADMVVDDETGLAHLLGDLLASPHVINENPAAESEPPSEESPGPDDLHEHDDDDADDDENYAEFRADSPLHAAEHEDEEDAGADSDDNDERANEELLRHFRPSWFSYPKSVLTALACIAIGIYLHQQHIGFLYVVALGSVAALCLLNVSVMRSTTDYYITTARVESEYGLVGRNSNEVRICDIRAIDVRMSGINALLGVGTVDFSSAGGSEVEVQFKNVRNPHLIKHIVRNLQG